VISAAQHLNDQLIQHALPVHAIEGETHLARGIEQPLGGR
jgi:hypothetical protein